MNARTRRRLSVMVVLAAGCGSDGDRNGRDYGVARAGADGSGGAGGTAGGEPAARGDADSGAAASGTASDGGYGAAGAGGAADAPDAGGEAWLTPPPVPPALVAPNGAVVKLHAHAVGAQIYTCVASVATTADGGADQDAGATSYAWALKAPDAKLYDAGGTQVGTHGAGPSWTWRDGSTAVGAKVVELTAPAAEAIPWLLLRVKSTSGAGLLSDATYVQRVNTAGGRAPATGCDATTVGTEARSGYAADYYFFSGGGAATWLLQPPTPNDVAVPTDVRLARHDRGTGAQIYACLASGAGGTTAFRWVLRSANVLLVDPSYAPVARLDAGPTWTAGDGSAVVAPEIAHAAAPRTGALPWTLHKELSTTGAGAFSRIAFIQEINTSGGVAPATGCGASNVDTLARVDYAADYYYYVPINEP